MELTMKETTLSLSMLPNSNSVSLLLVWIFSASKTGPFQFYFGPCLLNVIPLITKLFWSFLA